VNETGRWSAALACGVVALALAGRAGAQGPNTVIEVRVEGNRLLSDDAVLVDVRTRVGSEYDGEVVKADEQRLLRSGRYESVKISRTRAAEGVIVTFVVRERSIVAKVIFEGNKSLKTDDLIKELPFGVADPLNEYNVRAGRQAVLAKYRSSGYYFAEVTFDRDALRKHMQAVYRIVEGPRVGIRKIRYKGNKYFSTMRLRLQTRTSAWFLWIVPGLLDIEQVDQDVNALRNLYVAEGFLDAEVGRVLAFSLDKRKVTLTFVIHEGPRYRVNEVRFSGNTVFSDDELAERLKLRRGEFFQAIWLRRDARMLRNTYGELGYIEATVQPKRRYMDPDAPLPDWAAALVDEKPALLNVVFEITEADQYAIGRIDIRGHRFTKENVIRRELRFFPEQMYNIVVVDESERRLRETRLFEQVSITPVGQVPGVRDVLVTVREGRTAEFLVGAGVSTNSGLIGTISFTQRNFDLFAWPRSFGQFIRGESFKGAGQTFRIVAEPGTDLMRFHVEWFEPYLFDKPYSLGTRVFMFTRGRDAYDETRYGLVVSVGRRFKNRWYGELAGRVEGVEVGDLDTPVAMEITADKGQHALVGLKGTLVRDRTDSRWMPSAGDRFRLSYEQVAGSFDFGRADAEYRIYRTIYVDALDRKHIIAGRFGVGYIFGDAPIFERYYGGGIGSVRGFRYRGISPRGVGTTDAIGGDFQVFAGGEYSFPLVTDQLRGVVFIDTGTVEQEFEVTTYRASVGVGLRWIVPLFGQVPMSFDFAAPISSDGSDDKQVFSFNIGVTF